MIDLKKLKENPEAMAKRLASRGYTFDVAAFTQLMQTRSALTQATEACQAKRNQLAKAIALKVKAGEGVGELKAQAEALNTELNENKEALAACQAHWQAWQLEMPNLPDDETPVGSSEDDNIERYRIGEPVKLDKPLDHVSLGESLDGLSMEQGALISGSRFVVLKGQLAKLSRALVQFMLDVHVSEHGYTEVNVPVLVKQACMVGTGQLPKFAEDQFTLEKDGLSLAPTAEVPVTNLWRETVFDETDLPMKYVCHSCCFRREAGSAGKDTRGMIRTHQFEKVELVQWVLPEEGEQALERLTADAEAILKKLNLPYRVMTLCTGDLGFSSQCTHDLEVRLPSQNTYREISSCSHFGDFQARRMNTRCKRANDKPRFVHTLNGSGLAVGRTLVAILENYQDSNGKIAIPDALQGYFAGSKHL